MMSIQDVIAGLPLNTDYLGDTPRTRIWQHEGPIDADTQGWTFTPSKNPGKETYYPDEGYYPDRGGKLAGPRVPVEDAPYTFFHYTFEVQPTDGGYWGMDFYDAKGERITGDLYTDLHPCEQPMRYHGVFYGRARMASFQPFFQSIGGVSVASPTVERITWQAAAAWCDTLYEKLPLIKMTPEPDRWQHMPHTAEALLGQKPWHMLFLGHSLYNDTYNSNFEALVQREYPQGQPRFIWSGRGGTGCEHYKDTLDQYVYPFDPDMVIIGGYSKTHDIDDIASVIDQLRENTNCEMLLMSLPFGFDLREPIDDQPEAALPEQDIDLSRYPVPAHMKVNSGVFIQQQKELAEAKGIAFHNASQSWYDYLGHSGKPYQWFHRDRIHANDRGKQIIGRMLKRFLADARL